MGYVIYDAETTLLLTRKEYATKPAARAARTRILKKIHKESGQVRPWTDFMIAEADVFYASIEQRVARENMMSGNTYYEGVNTPSFMSPSSDAYWSA